MISKETAGVPGASEQNAKMPLAAFRGRPMPNEGFLAGYSALIDRYDLAVQPAPHGNDQVDLLLRFLRQNGGTLSKRARTREFAALDEDEVQRLQAAYGELFAPPE